MDAKMLDGKVAIVSGASYGMGQTMAELFAKEGAKVVMTARGKEKLDAAVEEIRSKGYDVTGVVADNKNLEDVQNVIRTAVDTYGDLDIVINNAAIGEQKMIDEAQKAKWDEYAINKAALDRGRNQKAREVAKDLLIEGDSVEKVVRVSKLSEADVLAIKAEIDQK